MQTSRGKALQKDTYLSAGFTDDIVKMSVII